MNNRGRIFGHLIFLLEGLSLGLGWYKSVYLIDEISVANFKIGAAEFSLPKLIVSMFVSILMLLYLKKKRSDSYAAESHMDLEIAFLPLLFAGPFFLIPCGLYTPLLLVLAVSLSILRYISLSPKALMADFKLKTSLSLAILFFFFIVFAAYETLVQQRSLDSFLLNYSDWGIYSNVADNTLKGKFFYSNELGRNYLGHHFMPGAFLALLPVIALFRDPLAVFAFNSIVLYLGAFIIYALALKKDMPGIYALGLALAYCLCPSLSNMALSMFYGFHPVYIAMPLIALFFLFYEKKNFAVAFLIFLFSLTIKETVAIFWIGAGAAIFIRGGRRAGLFIALISVAYFLSTTLFIIPAISGKEQYEFVSRFQHLGGSFTEIAFSPFTKPLLFMKTLFRPQNIYYVFILIIPVFVVALNSSLVLGVSFIILFSLLQGSDQLTHLGNHYQSEALMLIYISSVYGFFNCLKSSKEPPLLKFCLLGIRRGEYFIKNLPLALIAAVLFSSALSFYFLGKNFFSKNSDALCWIAPSYNKDLTEIKKIMPEGVSLTATPELGANFLFRNDVFLYYNRPLKDCILINLDDKFAHSQMLEDLRYELVSSKEHKLIRAFTIGGSIVLLYGKRKPGESFQTPKPGVTNVPLKDWKESRAMATQIPEIEYKVLFVEGQNKELSLIFRVMKKIDYDFDIQLEGIKGRGEVESLKQYSFGEGVYPAYMAEVGEAYVVNYSLPEGFNDQISIRLQPKPRPSKLPMSNPVKP